MPTVDSTSEVGPTAAPEARGPLSGRRLRLGGRQRSPLLLRVGLGIAMFLMATAILQPLVWPVEPGATDLAARLRGPGTDGHPLGTDALGRDVLARVLTGIRWSLGIGATATLIGGSVGAALGVGAGWSSGKTRVVLSRIIDLGISFPYLVTALTIIAVVGRGFWPLALTLGLVSWPTFARVVYAETLSLREREYVVAARLAGVGGLRSVVAHILPALRPAMQVLTAFMFAELLIAESGLSFLGLGAPLGTPTWGNMLSESRAYLGTAPWMMLAPAAAIILAVLAANFTGDGLTARSHALLERGTS